MSDSPSPEFGTPAELGSHPLAPAEASARSGPNGNASALRRRWEILFYLLAMLLVLGQVALDSALRYRSIQDATQSTLHRFPKWDYESETGFAYGRRVKVLPFGGTDTYHWIMHAQKLAHDQVWRIRWADYDNAPYGRPVHWSQSLIWLIAGLGGVVATFTGMPLGAAIEEAGVWAMMPVQVLALLLLPLLFARRFGFVGAGLLAIGLGATYSSRNLFMVGTTDHHGLVALFLLCSATGIIAGFLHLTREKLAAGWMMFSGAAFGAALWVSAATALPCFLGMSLAMLAWLLFERSAINRERFCGNLKLWSRAGAAASLFFYAVEYLPNHLELRLEVNGPIYSLCLLAYGEFIAGLTRVLNSRDRGERTDRATIASMILGFILFSAPIAYVLTAKSSAFLPSDDFLYFLHKQYINEFQPFWSWISDGGLSNWYIFSALLLAPLFCVAQLVHGIRDAGCRLAVATALGASAPLLGLAIFQLRWYNIGVLLSLPCLLVLAYIWREPEVRKWSWGPWKRGAALLGLLAFALPIPASSIALLAQTKGKLDIGQNPHDIVMIHMRDVAYRIKASRPSSASTVAAGPSATTWLIYFGGLKGLGTLYWENIEGLKGSSRIFAATDERTFARAIKERNVDFVVYTSADLFLLQYETLAKFLGLQPQPGESTFVSKLSRGFAPPWVSSLPVPSPAEARAVWASVYDVRKAPDYPDGK